MKTFHNSPLHFGEGQEKRLKISVIIPARNEEKNIEKLCKSLENQTFHNSFFEVIVIDDNSTDKTLSILRNIQKNYQLDLKIIIQTEKKHFSPKKNAITLGIQKAKGELIVCTDADCVASPFWLNEIWNFYQEKNAKLITAPVTFEIIDNHFFTHFQIIDFASLVISGAVSLAIGRPNMANGANLAYPKKVFEDLGGYQNTPQIASGDDEFWLHKVKENYPNNIFFIKNKQAIIQTKPSQTWQEFYQQRKRWASKWKYYQSFETKSLAFFIFLVNFNLIFSVFFYFLDFLTFNFLVLIWITKLITELPFLLISILFFNHQKSIFYLPLVQIVYPFYVTLFAFLGVTSTNYEWKGRKLIF
jgi:cellulose synthase/poly-beta-1,6-N-acetylglucosamine synthase-like glycosyltransferase